MTSNKTMFYFNSLPDSGDICFDQLVEVSVVIRTSEVGNTTVVVVSEVGGTAGAHRANKVVPLLGPEISETIHQ